jgi:hypothetical protein
VQIHSDALVTYPVDKVFPVVRDRLTELVPFLPAVDSIELQERAELGPGKVRLVNLWQGKTQVAPAAVRPFVTKGMVRWKDIAEWDQAAHSTRWHFETFHFEKLFECAGENRYAATPEGHTRIEIRGNLEIFTDRIPGVPGFLSRKLKPKIEKFIVELVTPNLRDLGQGVQRFLDRQGGK